MEQNEKKLSRNRTLETSLAIAAGLSFYIMCMIFSMVGPSGSRVPFAAANKATFLSVLLATLLLGGASAWFSLQRRREEGGAFPRFSTGLCALCLVVLVIVLFNGFAI